MYNIFLQKKEAKNEKMSLPLKKIIEIPPN